MRQINRWADTLPPQAIPLQGTVYQDALYVPVLLSVVRGPQARVEMRFPNVALRGDITDVQVPAVTARATPHLRVLQANAGAAIRLAYRIS